MTDLIQSQVLHASRMRNLKILIFWFIAQKFIQIQWNYINTTVRDYICEISFLLIEIIQFSKI